MELVHGTTVAIADKGVLIRGESGIGKSDLALRLIDGGAVLVSDDQTAVTVLGGRLVASAPPAIAGLLEVRGLGLVRLPHRDEVPLGLVVDLVAADTVERMPEDHWASFHGIAVAAVRLAAFEASTPAKVRLAAICPTRDIIRS